MEALPIGSEDAESSRAPPAGMQASDVFGMLDGCYEAIRSSRRRTNRITEIPSNQISDMDQP